MIAPSGNSRRHLLPTVADCFRKVSTGVRNGVLVGVLALFVIVAGLSLTMMVSNEVETLARPPSPAGDLLPPMQEMEHALHLPPIGVGSNPELRILVTSDRYFASAFSREPFGVNTERTAYMVDNSGARIGKFRRLEIDARYEPTDFGFVDNPEIAAALLQLIADLPKLDTLGPIPNGPAARGAWMVQAFADGKKTELSFRSLYNLDPGQLQIAANLQALVWCLDRGEPEPKNCTHWINEPAVPVID